MQSGILYLVGVFISMLDMIAGISSIPANATDVTLSGSLSVTGDNTTN